MKFDKEKTLYGLVAVMVLQLAVLVMEYGNAVYPLVTGEEIKLKVIPVDPRSLFRGNYARLRYDISRVYIPDSPGKLRKNEIVYVNLKQDDEGFYVEDGVSLKKPDEGLFIQGRTRRVGRGTVNVRYGIEAFFAPKDKALDLEKKLRSGGVAVVMLSKGGKPALKDVIAE